mmetsp:Transcript_99721/g.307622  ORF Transcript_99721/g.307622 Transcript_99721/m.307622 type:complete len:252 (-) Transcript_99721:323-1078(-)
MHSSLSSREAALSTSSITMDLPTRTICLARSTGVRPSASALTAAWSSAVRALFGTLAGTAVSPATSLKQPSGESTQSSLATARRNLPWPSASALCSSFASGSALAFCPRLSQPKPFLIGLLPAVRSPSAFAAAGAGGGGSGAVGGGGEGAAGGGGGTVAAGESLAAVSFAAAGAGGGGSGAVGGGGNGTAGGGGAAVAGEALAAVSSAGAGGSGGAAAGRGALGGAGGGASAAGACLAGASSERPALLSSW